MKEAASVPVLTRPKLPERPTDLCFVAWVLLDITQFVKAMCKLALCPILACPKLTKRLTQLCLVQALPQIVPRRAVPLVDVAAAAGLAVPPTSTAPSIPIEVHRAVAPIDPL